LRLRGDHLHRRHRPGGGARARAPQGEEDGREESLRRGPARRIRPRLRVPDVPGERRLRRRVPSRHVDRPAADRQASGQSRKKGGAPYSMDANLLHISYEGGELEDPGDEPEESMWRMTVSPQKAPQRPQDVELEYRKGDIVAVNGKKLSPARVLAELNRLGGRHGVGRLDLVENRYVGMKSRGCYETPGGTIMLKAHRAMESITLDREVLALKDDLMPRYA